MQLRFFAFHGLYEEEKKTGNEFEMDVLLTFQPTDRGISNVEETIDYAVVYAIIAQEMQKPRALLETFLHELAVVIKDTFPIVQHLQITLYKLTAPIQGITGKVGVTIERKW